MGKHEQARDVLRKLYHDPAHPTEAGPLAELTQIVRQVEADKQEIARFIQMFKKPN